MILRRAGFADKDFGGHNVLVGAASDGPWDPVWAELERAFEAPPDDPEPTRQTAGAALARWGSRAVATAYRSNLCFACSTSSCRRRAETGAPS